MHSLFVSVLHDGPSPTPGGIYVSVGHLSRTQAYLAKFPTDQALFWMANQFSKSVVTSAATFDSIVLPYSRAPYKNHFLVVEKIKCCFGEHQCFDWAAEKRVYRCRLCVQPLFLLPVFLLDGWNRSGNVALQSDSPGPLHLPDSSTLSMDSTRACMSESWRWNRTNPDSHGHYRLRPLTIHQPRLPAAQYIRDQSVSKSPSHRSRRRKDWDRRAMRRNVWGRQQIEKQTWNKTRIKTISMWELKGRNQTDMMKGWRVQYGKKKLLTGVKIRRCET